MSFTFGLTTIAVLMLVVLIGMNVCRYITAARISHGVMWARKASCVALLLLSGSSYAAVHFISTVQQLA